jgi:hypothetical protein
MTDWDEFIRRRFREMTGIADVGDVVLMTMSRPSPQDKFYVEMTIVLEKTMGGMMKVGYLSNSIGYMTAIDNITRGSTILVRGAASPTVVSQFNARENLIRSKIWGSGSGKDHVEDRIGNYQYLLKNSNIPSQEQAKKIIGLPPDF